VLTINHVARTLSQKLYELKDRIQNAVVSRVVEDFIDISSPLKHFTDAVHVAQGWLDVVSVTILIHFSHHRQVMASRAIGFGFKSIQVQFRYFCML
jgi:hypothetical protein